jgi:predicted GIY-YIG superfamily endonuclease
MKDYQKMDVKNICYILKINDKEIYKVGVTNKLKARLRNLRVSIYEDVECVNEYEFKSRKDALECERNLKKNNKEHRIKGEWYSKNPKI